MVWRRVRSAKTEMTTKTLQGYMWELWLECGHQAFEVAPDVPYPKARCPTCSFEACVG